MNVSRKNRFLQALSTALLFMGVFFVLIAWLGNGWGAGEGAGLVRQFRYGLHFLKGNASSFLLAGVVSLGGAWLGIRAWMNAQKPIWLPGVLLSLFFTQNTLLHIAQPNALKFLLLCPQYGIVDNLVLWCVFFAFYYGLIQAFCLWLTAPKTAATTERKTWSGGVFVGIIAVCWIPILYLRLPGSILYDTDRQILQYQGYIPWESANPVFLTAVYGFLFSLGQKIGGDNCGLLFCTAAQLLLTLTAMGLACREIDGFGRRRISVLLALFYGLCPLYPDFASLVLKDSVYGPLFLLFVIYYLRVLEGGSRRDKIGLILMAVLCALTRKGGGYLSVGALLCLLPRRELRRLSLTVSGVLLAGMFLLEQAVFPALGIEKPWKRENYSFFYNLTCVYCEKYPEELTSEDVAAISAVLDYDAVRNNYDPKGIDSIKNTFHAENDREIRRYLAHNLKFILRHPTIVPESLLYSKGLYFNPFELRVESIINPVQWNFSDCVPGTSSDFHYWAPDAVRKPAEETIFDVTHQFPQAILLSSGTYSWMCLLLLTAALWKRDRRTVQMILPTLLAVGGLLLTHTSGTIRYAAPVIFSVPLLLAWLYVWYRAEALPPNSIQSKENSL